MTITTRESGKQHYTLLVSHNTEEDTSRSICTYGVEGPILTTDHDALVAYAMHHIKLFGTSRTYTIATVSKHIVCNLLIEQ